MNFKLWNFKAKINACLYLALQCQTLFKKRKKKRPNGGRSHRLENVSNMNIEEIGWRAGNEYLGSFKL
jgi:hypothetical protein